MSGGAPSVEDELARATEDLQGALDALRRAQSFWPGARPWTGKTWDLVQAARAIEEAEVGVRSARERLERAMRAAKERRLRNGAKD